MSALPVIERELRVRARRKSTFWLRVVAALLASVTAVTTLSWSQFQTGGTWRPGKPLFDTLSALAFVFCLVEGVRQTADCLSQEKREGTLGFLFLTDLSGFDVIVGKLAAASLGSFYALLAVFPPMASALPVGGLSVGEFWRTQLALLDTLFLGLACGLWASAKHREENRALLGGLKLALAVTVLPALLEFVLRPLLAPSLSPGVAMYLAGDAAYLTQAPRFWLTLLFIHLLSWALLALAGRRLSETWRDDSPDSMEEKAPTDLNGNNEDSESGTQSGEPSWPYIDTGVSPPPRRPGRDEDPAAWLASRSRSHQKVILISFVLLGLTSPLAWATFSGAFGFFSGILQALSVVPLLLLAFVSSRPLAEARRRGSLELLLGTPLSPESIVRGHWQALWSQLRGPLATALIITGGITLLGAVLSGGAGMAGYLPALLLQTGQRILAAFAACWLGLYLGLRTRSTMMAVGHNLLCVVVVPWIAGSLFWVILRLLAPMGIFTGFLLHFLWVALEVGFLWWLLRWAQRQLFTRFRELATQPS
jgi:ABC-type Na+ efflux pump permease subunit